MDLDAARLPRARHEVLGTHLSSWRSWAVRSRCSHLECPPNRMIAVTDIADSRGDVTLEGMADGIRCSACGATAGAVSLVLRLTAGESIQRVRSAA
ncbi:hypothetical protein BKE38_07155 [Pseudoroseomonas deserti]|uniref:Uncharacterized protein n=1 Tax=Teichococcus deserti TaxID=1817963 RepID=A0A1V2H571_9PROT|nr:hypothetical protein BKE38_07155 [Pseudoroseomonas deserti]